MTTVSNKAGLKRALENREKRIICIGELAKSMRRRSKVRKATMAGAAVLVIGGVIAIPFTGGASAGISAMGLTLGRALTVGTVTISVQELIILCALTLGVIGILKGASVEFRPDGSVVITPSYR